MTLDYLDADVWTHSMDDPQAGIRVLASHDAPNSLVLQIRDNGGTVHSARVTPALLRDLHQQAVTA